MRYKTKEFMIEAVKFTGDNFDEVVATLKSDWKGHSRKYFKAEGSGYWRDETIVANVYDELHKTWMGVHIGDYIIRGMKDELYPCVKEVFEAKYEAI